MRNYSKYFLFLGFALTLSAGGCGWAEPYVYAAGEFNRESSSFGKKLENRKKVSVCYNRGSATPRQVLELAQAECGKFQKVARFTGHERLKCPLFTPVTANFSCDKP
ncbi:MAG: hypothetical protein HN403_09970 [Rhodospirillales bacterium]|jgi:hypothetical protein|nr:hypothetical protein [Rhodospirillales bacterium]